MQAVRSLQIQLVPPAELERFEALLAQQHYLGSLPSVGDFLRQVVVRDGQWVALPVWGPAALKLKDRGRWMGWNPAMAAERLKLIVQNRRVLLLHEKGAEAEPRKCGAGGVPRAARAVAGAFRLPAASGGKLHRSGDLLRDMLQGRRLATGGHE